MSPIREQLDELMKQTSNAYKKLGYSELTKEAEEIEAQMARPGFWDDQKSSSKNAKKLADIKKRIEPWQVLITEAIELIDLAELGDKSLEADIIKQFKKLNDIFETLKSELKFSGPYDKHPAIISIFAGAGGTDAQGWAEMLMRMYLRYLEKNQLKARIVSQSPGEEAGIKSVSIEIPEPMSYGRLKGEHGVHRLVRLSPYNADNLRQTSFARVEIMPMIEEPAELPIDEKDLKIDVFRSGGSGGQSVNTTDSAVRITHLPTGVSVAIQNERSQLQNKETAMTIIRSKLAQLQLEQHQDTLAEIKGPNEQAAWGNQIRNYVLHPYKQVKDLRTGFESNEPDKILDGEIEPLINASLDLI